MRLLIYSFLKLKTKGGKINVESCLFGVMVVILVIGSTRSISKVIIERFDVIHTTLAGSTTNAQL